MYKDSNWRENNKIFSSLEQTLQVCCQILFVGNEDYYDSLSIWIKNHIK